MKYISIILWVIVSIGWCFAAYVENPISLMFLTLLWVALTIFNIAIFWPEEKQENVSKGSKWSREDD